MIQYSQIVFRMHIDGGKAMDDLCENKKDLLKLIELVEPWKHDEAREVAQRIIDRQIEWINISQ